MYIAYLVQDNKIQLQKLRSRRNTEVQYFWTLKIVAIFILAFQIWLCFNISHVVRFYK